MRKIDASKWTAKPSYNKITNTYIAPLAYYTPAKSEHGKSTAEVACGFCKTHHEVYVWSFRGSGKLCKCCGALMCVGDSMANATKVKNLNPNWIF